MERLKYVPALWIYSSMDRRDTVFLDSSMGGGRSYIGLMPHRVFLPGESDAVEVLDGMSDDDVLMGYLSYDYGLFLHGISSIHPKTQIPDFILADFDVVIEEDPVGKRLHVTCRGRVMPVCDEERFVMRLVEGASPPEDIPGHGYDVVSDMSRSDFVRSVEEARSMMAEGEFYVINLSRSISVRSSSDPFGTFLRLRRLSPSPFGAYADLCGIQIASSSMEMLLDHRDGVVRTRPIKGTSPRTGDSKKDRDSLSALLSSDKDRSELLMVTDMERNDMNRFCVPGSVDVGSFFRPEVYSTLYHTVSDVVGRVREGVRTGEMVSCMFPGGSVTGAPKEVCMEAIDSLEACRRGIYTGSMGIFSAHMTEMSITIRTMVHSGDTYTIGVGSGITYESDPDAEYDETSLKALAMLRSLEG
ncbi:anthranilate synthase component I family protein [Methanomethylophilus alvi]|uniref:anthranilate synthase component I family protein n=1 Tax=Methanomethylophilus alvi TaxID=1291540 RepID=UPI0037DC63F4|nr:anthranilate synthase component I family protein [Methanomethylophilus alvi]